MKLYYHKTDGGAEYLTDSYYNWNDNGKRKRAGCFNHKTKYIVRIDGDITKDAELTIKKDEYYPPMEKDTLRVKKLR